MSRLDNQRRLFLDLVETLRPHWRRDRNLPAHLHRWLLGRRAGSRDRRLYRELAYTAIRILPWIEHESPERLVALVATCATPTPATQEFIDRFRLPAIPNEYDAQQLLPDWVADQCPAALAPPHRDALLRRAPLWIRHQRGSAAGIRDELIASGWLVAPSDILHTAWRLEGEGDVTRTAAYADGLIEIQDLGSQLLLPSVGPTTGEHWLDACAGAGGKTLQLAQLLGPEGRVDAHDIRSHALAELQQRVHRAGLRNVTIAMQPQGSFDGVLVDAPCTGSGTWRRSPHLKWTTTRADIVRAAAVQRDLLERYAALVRPGGRLVYATCSLCRSENDNVVQAFLTAHPEWDVLSLRPPPPLHPGSRGLTILPADVDSDAFFVTCLSRASL